MRTLLASCREMVRGYEALAFLILVIVLNIIVDGAKGAPLVPQGMVVEEDVEVKEPSIQTLAAHVEAGKDGFSAKLVVIIENRGPRELDDAGISFLKRKLQEELEETAHFFNSFEKENWLKVPDSLVGLYQESTNERIRTNLRFAPIDWMKCEVVDVLVADLTLPPR